MLKRFCLPILVIITLHLISCQQSNNTGNKTLDTSSDKQEQKVRLNVDRFEMDLFSIPIDSVSAKIPWLKARYGTFFDIFTNKIINIGSSKRPDFEKNLKSFITDRYMFLTYQKVKEVYPDIKAPVSELEDAFDKYQELFSGKKIPHFYTLISGYNQSVVTDDTILGVGLDKYLGPDCEYYENLQIPKYQRALMGKDYISTDAMRGWCYSEFPYNDSAENVLTNILYEGKMTYLMKELFPQKDDTIILGYSKKHMDWCRSNLDQMWTFLVENKLLFSTDYMTITKLINPAPFTALFNNESPGKAVVWLGYKIIDAYMKNNDVSVSELMADQKYQAILEKSKFEPK
jgi:hypothetical protein